MSGSLPYGTFVKHGAFRAWQEESLADMAEEAEHYLKDEGNIFNHPLR